MPRLKLDIGQQHEKMTNKHTHKDQRSKYVQTQRR